MKCQCCEVEGAIRRRQNTAYADDELNFAVLCDECQKETHEYWQERWEEYYSNCMQGRRRKMGIDSTMKMPWDEIWDFKYYRLAYSVRRIVKRYRIVEKEEKE